MCDLLSPIGLAPGLQKALLILGCSCSPVSSQIMLSSEKEFTAEKTLFQFDFGLASGLFVFLNGFTECSSTMIVATDHEAFKNDV